MRTEYHAGNFWIWLWILEPRAEVLRSEVRVWISLEIEKEETGKKGTRKRREEKGEERKRDIDIKRDSPFSQKRANLISAKSQLKFKELAESGVWWKSKSKTRAGGFSCAPSLCVCGCAQEPPCSTGFFSVVDHFPRWKLAVLPFLFTSPRARTRA